MDDFFEEEAAQQPPQVQQQQPQAQQAQALQSGFDGMGGDEEDGPNPYENIGGDVGGVVDESEDIFGDAQQPSDGLSNAVDEKADESGDIFSGIQTQDDNQAEPEDEQEPTFLSVWQEQRRQTLEERRAKEREQQQELAQQAVQDLEKFHQDRSRRVDGQKEQNRIKEKTLREDLQAVFEHGTIWEQVGKMANLQENTGRTRGTADQERMRALLIHLKNEKKQ